MSKFKLGDLVRCCCRFEACSSSIHEVVEIKKKQKEVICEDGGAYNIDMLVNMNNISKLERIVYGLDIDQE